MTIKVGEKIPSVTLHTMENGSVNAIKTEDLFKGKKVVLFALPGAFEVSSAEAVLKVL